MKRKKRMRRIGVKFSDDFAHGLGVFGFFNRLFAGFVCFIILAIVTYIATRKYKYY